MNTLVLFSVLIVVLASAVALAQTANVTTLVEDLSVNEVVQGESVTVRIRGQGLEGVSDVLISNNDNEFTVTIEDVAEDELKVTINMSCDAEPGKRVLSLVGDAFSEIDASQDGRRLYFYGLESACGAANVTAADTPVTVISGLFPRKVYQGGTEQGYFIGEGLLNISKIRTSGTDVEVKIFAGAEDNQLPIEFIVSDKAQLGGVALIPELKDGSTISSFRNGDVIKVEVVRPRDKPEPADEPEPLPKTDIKTDVTPGPALITTPQPVEETCPPIALFVDGKKLGDTIEPVDGVVKLTVKLGPGVLLERAGAVSPDPVVQRVFNHFLKQYVGTRVSKCTERTKTFRVPSKFPRGKTPITFGVQFSTPDVEHRKAKKESTLVIPEGMGGFKRALISRRAEELLAARQLGLPERLDRDFDLGDLTLSDLKMLGISKKDFLEGLRRLRAGDIKGAKELLGELKKLQARKRTSTDEDVGKLKEHVRDQIRQNIRGDRDIDPDVEVRVFEVEKDGKKVVKSKVTIEIPPQKHDIGKGELIIYIPKEIAENVDGIVFSEDVIVIEEDPVVKWAFQNVPQDQYREYSFTTDGDAQNFEVVAQAAADKPGFLTNFVLWIVSIFGA